MHLLCVIAARVASTRLPEKPLRLLAGEPLISVVTRRVLALGLDAHVVVATDDDRVIQAVARLGVEAILTSAAHRSGTDRVAEVARQSRFARAQTVLNVQGDEPFFPFAAARGALARVQNGDPVGTAGAPLATSAAADPNRVKVVVDAAGRALRFARLVPQSATLPAQVEVLHHIGIYAYRRQALLRWAAFEPVPAEREEGLEQLRPLTCGIPVGVARIVAPVRGGIDTEDDLADAERQMSRMSQEAE